MFALDYDSGERGTVYEVIVDGPLESDPESLPWMRGLMCKSATVVRDLGRVCVCGSGESVDLCCGETVLNQTRWARLNPELVERLSACRVLAVLPYFVPVAVDASPVALRSDVHGPGHWEQVALNGLYVASSTCADLRVVLAFALLHDAFRSSDGTDGEHGARAADWALENAEHLENVSVDLLCTALRDHTTGKTSIDPTIGACWDADRLDLVRLGVSPRPELMSTEPGTRAAKKLSRLNDQQHAHEWSS